METNKNSFPFFLFTLNLLIKKILINIDAIDVYYVFWGDDQNDEKLNLIAISEVVATIRGSQNCITMIRYSPFCTKDCINIPQEFSL